jgi:hypothetical protein
MDRLKADVERYSSTAKQMHDNQQNAENERDVAFSEAAKLRAELEEMTAVAQASANQLGCINSDTTGDCPHTWKRCERDTAERIAAWLDGNPLHDGFATIENNQPYKYTCESLARRIRDRDYRKERG